MNAKTLGEAETAEVSGGGIPWAAVFAGIAAYDATRDFLEGYSEGLEAGLADGMKVK